MRLSACITIYDREVPVLQTVFDSMRDQAHDELVIVLDRTPPKLADYCKTAWKDDPRARFVEIPGDPGWRSPVTAWNTGFNAVTGDALYCFSSETVQAPGNLDKAKRMLSGHDQNSVIFGRAECSCGPNGTEVNWNGTAPGSLLTDAAHPRPLGFIWAAPTANVRKIHGFDERFSAGFWYDDNDLFCRLWLSGLNFTFDDSISGIHFHHDRPVLNTPAGQLGIRKNATYMTWKHGSLDPLAHIQRTIEARPGRTVWGHL